MTWGWIYTIRRKTNDQILYVGSTKRTIESRFIDHKSASVHDHKALYVEMRRLGGCDKVYAKQELMWDFESNDQMRRTEQKFIDFYHPPFNMSRAHIGSITQVQYDRMRNSVNSRRRSGLDRIKYLTHKLESVDEDRILLTDVADLASNTANRLSIATEITQLRDNLPPLVSLNGLNLRTGLPVTFPLT